MNTSKPGSQLNTRIYQEACEWLIAFRTGGADAHDKMRLDAWLRRSPEHVRAYLEVNAIWDDVALLDPQRATTAETHIARAGASADDNVIPLDVIPAQARSTAETPHVADTHESFLPERERSETSARTDARYSARAWFAFAASALLTIVGTWYYTQRGTYSTDIGEQRSVTLVDGSVIDLNARSRIKIRYGADERYVDLLEGQALFHVAKDAARPFIVRSAETSVRAVGTQFDVYRKKSGTIVTVVEGRVAVASSQLPRSDSLSSLPRKRESSNAGEAASGTDSGSRSEPPSVDPAPNSKGAEGEGSAPGEILLAAGEQLSITAEAARKIERANITAATAWTQRRLVFNSAPLSEVVEEFNRYNTRQLVIDAPELEHFGVIGVFSSTDPGSLLRFLSAQPGIAVKEGRERIRITRE